jgi:hypothetical protein
MKNNNSSRMCFSKTLKPILLLLLFLLTSINSINAQDPEIGPLKDSYIIQNGGGDELVTGGSQGINIFKYYKAFEKYPTTPSSKPFHGNGVDTPS